MTDHAPVVPDQGAEIRWRQWEARGAANERRTAVRMRRLMILFFVALVVWFFVRDI